MAIAYGVGILTALDQRERKRRGCGGMEGVMR
jgi:hypothetical protein